MGRKKVSSYFSFITRIQEFAESLIPVFFTEQAVSQSPQPVHFSGWITRVFKFKNFLEALDFTNKVGEIAESEGHHPEITTEWGKVTVQWWTHKIKGLHENDFGMAAKTDLLLK